MIAPSPANPPVIAAQPDRIKRQDVVVLTQTIVTPDSTRTAVITLGNGGHPDAGGSVATIAPNSPPSSPPPASSGPPKDTGLSPAQIGIILGCCLGAAVLLVILWFCLSRVRIKREFEVNETLERRTWASTYGSSYFTEEEEESRRYYDNRPNHPDPSVPRRHGWPTWRSIPPPVVPMYRARNPPDRRWQASARASTTMRPG
ncbi:hypothetical protein PG990_011614 [Apiospora arundinis]